MALSNLELGDIALYIVGSKNRWVPLRWYTGIVGGSNVVSTFSKFSLLTNVIGFNPGIPSITIDGPDDGNGVFERNTIRYSRKSN